MAIFGGGRGGVCFDVVVFSRGRTRRPNGAVCTGKNKMGHHHIRGCSGYFRGRAIQHAIHSGIHGIGHGVAASRGLGNFGCRNSQRSVVAGLWNVSASEYTGRMAGFGVDNNDKKDTRNQPKAGQPLADKIQTNSNIQYSIIVFIQFVCNYFVWIIIDVFARGLARVWGVFGNRHPEPPYAKASGGKLD